MNNWSVLVHHAAMHHSRPGQEDTTPRVLSSVHSDVGVSAMIREPQEDPADYQVREESAPARLLTFVRRWAATLPSQIVGREAGDQGSGISDRPRALPGEAGR